MKFSPDTRQPYYIPRNYRVPATLIRNLDMQLPLDSSAYSKKARNRTNQTINTTINSPQRYCLENNQSFTTNQSIQRCLQGKNTNTQLLKQKLAQLMSKKEQDDQIQKQISLSKNIRTKNIHKLTMVKKLQEINEQKKQIYEKYKHVCDKQRKTCYICQQQKNVISNLKRKKQTLMNKHNNHSVDQNCSMHGMREYPKANITQSQLNHILASQQQNVWNNKNQFQNGLSLELYNKQLQNAFDKSIAIQDNIQQRTSIKPPKSRFSLKNKSLQNKQNDLSKQENIGYVKKRNSYRNANAKLMFNANYSQFRQNKRNSKLVTQQKSDTKGQKQIQFKIVQTSNQKLKSSKSNIQPEKKKIKKKVYLKTDVDQSKQKKRTSNVKKGQTKNKPNTVIESTKSVKIAKQIGTSQVSQQVNQENSETPIPSIGKILIKKNANKRSSVRRKEIDIKKLKEKAITNTKLFIQGQCLSLLQIQNESQEDQQFCIYKNPIENPYNFMSRYEQQKFLFGLMQQSLLTKSRNARNSRINQLNRSKSPSFMPNNSTFRQFIEKVLILRTTQVEEQQQQASIFKNVFRIDTKRKTGKRQIVSIPLNQIKNQVTKKLTKISKLFEKLIQVHAFYLYLQKTLKDKIRLINQLQFKNSDQNEQIKIFVDSQVNISQQIIQYRNYRWEQETIDRSYAFQSYTVQIQQNNARLGKLGRFIQNQQKSKDQFTELGQKGYYQQDYEVQESSPYKSRQ